MLDTFYDTFHRLSPVTRITSSDLKKIESYFRDAHPDLPPLLFSDKDQDGRMDLFLMSGRAPQPRLREVSILWAELLRPVALRHQKGKDIELSQKDILDHFVSLSAEQGYTVLPNGFAVSVTSDPTAPIVSAALSVFVGGMEDPPAQVGLTHLLEHAVVNASHPPGGFWIDNAKSCGAVVWDATTFAEGTTFGFTALPHQLSECLQNFSTLAVPQSFQEREVQREIYGTFQEEHMIRNADPIEYAGRFLRSATFTGHPFAWGALGQWEKLSSVNVATLAAHHGNFYRPNNMFLHVTGNITLNDVRQMLLTTHFGKADPVALPHLQKIPTLKNGGKTSVHIWGEDGWPQGASDYAAVMWPIPSRFTNPKLAAPYAAFRALLNFRLNERLEEEKELNGQGTIFSVEGLEEYHVGDVGYLVCGVAISDTATSEATQDALVFILGEAERIARHGIAPGELELVQHLLAHEEAIAEDKPQQDQYRMKALHSRFSVQDAPASFSPRDIQSVAKKFFTAQHARSIAVFTKDHAPSQRDGELIFSTRKLRPRIASIAHESPYKIPPPKPSPASSLPPTTLDVGPNTQRLRLKNGMTVVTHNRPDKKLMEIELRIHVGREHDPPELGGLTEIHAQVLQQRSRDDVVVSTATASTTLRTSILADFWPSGLQALLSPLSTDVFTENDIVYARNAFVRDARNNFEVFIHQKIAEYLVGEQVVRYFPYSTRSGEQNTRPEHLKKRTRAMRDFRRWQVTLVGDFQNNNRLQTILDALAQLNSIEAKEPSITAVAQKNERYQIKLLPLPSSETTGMGFREDVRGSFGDTQSPFAKVTVGFVGPKPGDPEFYAFSLFADIIWEYVLSRLSFSGGGGESMAYKKGRRMYQFGNDAPVLDVVEYNLPPEGVKKVGRIIEETIDHFLSAGAITSEVCTQVIRAQKTRNFIDGDPPTGQLERLNSTGGADDVTSFREQVIRAGQKYFGKNRKGYVVILKPKKPTVHQEQAIPEKGD